MGVVVTGPACSLQDDDGTDIDLYAGALFEYITKTRKACSHEVGKKLWIAIEPETQEIWYRQNDVTIDDSR